MTHSLKLTLASAMAQKSTEAKGEGAPFDERVESPPSSTNAPSSSLISDLNAPVDPEEAYTAAQAALARGLWDAADRAVYGDEYEWRKKAAEARMEERARIRAIVLRHFGNDWAGNAVLEEIGDA